MLIVVVWFLILLGCMFAICKRFRCTILFCLSIEGNCGKYLIMWPHFGFQDKLKERERELCKRKEREEQEMERVRIKVRRKEAIVSY